MQTPTANNWQISPYKFGSIDEGIADINTCINTIIVTPRGSDVLRPDFGTDMYKLIDKPVSSSIPTLMKEISEGIALYEKRIKIVTLVFQPDGTGTGGAFVMTWQLVDSDLIAQYLLKYPY